MRLRALPIALAVLASTAAVARAKTPETPNELFARGLPTFVVGTAGDDDCDRKIRAQAEMIRGMLFPAAKVIEDTEIDISKGEDGWPANPVIYGGPHVNAVVAALSKRLPFSMSAGRLAIGGETFKGEEYRLIALVPGRAGTGDEPAFPPFVLYAGCGSPGVAEINGISHGGEGFLVADRFGRLTGGGFVPDGAGGVTAKPAFRARRLPWRIDRGIARLTVLPRPDGADAVDAACRRGVARAAKALVIDDTSAITVYVYPDRGSKRSLTGDAGDGRADVVSRTVHVLPFDAGEGGTLETLIAHEAAHVFAYDAWGPAGTPLMAEGLAVRIAGRYGGVALDAWARAASDFPSLTELLTGFRRLPEQETYPPAGLFVRALIGKLGEEAVRDHLYGATPAEWAAAAVCAGTTAKELEELYASLRQR